MQNYCSDIDSVSFFYKNHAFYIRKCCFTKCKKIDFNNIIKSNSLDDLVQKITYYKKTDRGAISCKGVCKTSHHIKNVDLSGLRQCNLNCYHCFWENKHYDDSPKFIEKYLKLLDFLSKQSLDNLTLDGSGEIFVYWPRIKHFLENITFNNIKNISFITNGTLLSKTLVDDLLSIQQNTGVNFSFNISIDGITKKTYEDIRVGANFDQLIKNIKYLTQFFYVNFNFTLKKNNYKEAFQLKDFLQSNFIFPNGGRVDFLIDQYDLKLNKYFKYLHSYEL